jgi:hypothetical protein
MSCPEGLVFEGGLCYSPCPEGYESAGDRCLQVCPNGYADLGSVCLKSMIPRSHGDLVEEVIEEEEPIVLQSVVNNQEFLQAAQTTNPNTVRKIPYWGWIIFGAVILLIIAAFVIWLVLTNRSKTKIVGQSNTLEQYLRVNPQRQIIV